MTTLINGDKPRYVIDGLTTIHRKRFRPNVEEWDNTPFPLEGNFNRYMVRQFWGCLEYVGFLQFCKRKITDGGMTYEELFDEEGCSEENGTMWYIWKRDLSKEEALQEIDEAIERERVEMVRYSGVTSVDQLEVITYKVMLYMQGNNPRKFDPSFDLGD